MPRRKPRKKSNATLLAHRKFCWLEQLAADSDISIFALRACIMIAARASLDHGGCAVIRQDIIAKKLGAYRQRVNEGVQLAVALGHLELISRGRNRPKEYRMVLKDEAVAASETAAAVVRNHGQQESATTDILLSATADVCCPQSRTDCSFFSPGALTEPPGGERERALNALDDPPLAGAPPLTRHPAEKHESSPSGVPASGPETPIERSRSVERAAIEERFRELRALWERPWADDVEADRRAFEAACREVAPEDIIAAAQAWVAAHDNLRFLPTLAKWLSNRGWQKPPPAKARRAEGSGRHNGHRGPPVANVFFQMAGYQQDADGNWIGGVQ